MQDDVLRRRPGCRAPVLTVAALLVFLAAGFRLSTGAAATTAAATTAVPTTAVPTTAAGTTSATTPVAAGTSSATPPAPAILDRLAGTDRYATAAEVAETTFPAGATTAVVASGSDFPDALTGAFLAGLQPGGAPVLLVAPEAPVPSATVTALLQLHVTRVILVGGPAAVSPGVASALAALPGPSGHLAVSRLSGATRYDTMAAVDSPPGSGQPAIGQVGGLPTAVLATGTGFADALGAAPLAYARHFPLVLTDGPAPALPAQAVSVLSADHIGHVIVVGGPAAIDPAQLSQLRSLGMTLDLSATTGQDRSGTSVELAALEISSFGFSAVRFDVVRGDQFADALAGGPLGGSQLAPTLVTLSPQAAGSVTAFLASHAVAGLSGYVLGGTEALSPALVDGLDAASTPPTTTTTTTTTSTTTTTTPTNGAGTSPYTAGAEGYDVSWPQCGGALPPQTGLSVVGVDDGHPFSTNPCLGSEAAWAGSNPSGYFTVASPPASWSTSGCAAGAVSCIAYAYGQATATAALEAARSAGLSAPVWWVAVVTAETWSTDLAANASVVQGALATLADADATAGVYSSASQWQAVVGTWTAAAPVWLPTSPTDPPAACGTAGASGSAGSSGFSSGPVWLVQVSGPTWDQDGACPLPAGAMVPPTGSTPPSTSDPYASGATGYDISWPQCPGTYPAAGELSVVGVNGGHPFSTNPCLAAELGWAGSGLSVYLNLSSPTGTAESLSGPAGACAPSDLSCQSYNFGANAVTYSLQVLRSAGATARYVWLDVETANLWSSSPADNAEVIQGALAALSSAGLGGGIYSSTYQWDQIAGSWTPSVPEWVPSGLGSSAAAAGYCHSTYFTSGPTWLVQYGAGSYDGDVAC